MLKKIVILSILTLISCNKTEPTHKVQKNQIPEALQEQTTISIGRYRSHDDLSEEIYQELVSNSIELKTLESELEKFNPKDTLNLFDNYNEKSEDYYRYADSKVNLIRDTILKNKILNVLEKSNEKYIQKTTELNQLLKTIYQKRKAISDYHTALKIILTIPVMEKYQNENIPKKSSFEKVIKNQNALIEKIIKSTPK
ncbi:hypothetical protein [Flavobacterium sp. N502536]|uniref:hypothetical protein n=1 Tax=Flavobacterium sp. N502536 TaxID=2986837 RepID=UPI00222193D9|nr:hypothetical protein [Flavobacterium sp. N502536]